MSPGQLTNLINRKLTYGKISEYVLQIIWIFFVDFSFVFQDGPFVKLKMGCELSVYVDAHQPTHCFNPCGHVASENTVRYVALSCHIYSIKLIRRNFQCTHSWMQNHHPITFLSPSLQYKVIYGSNFVSY